MRVDSHTVGSVMHIIKCGARGMEIVRDDNDRFAFVRTAFIVNDKYQNNNWRSYTASKPLFYRPEAWPEKEPLVSVLAYTLLNNHFHMLLQELEDGGIAKYMQRFCNGMARAFNEKYGGQGTIFQGGYKGRVVESDEYLHYVQAYIVVKNVFDMYPGGLTKALAQFERAWAFAETYQFSSFLTAAQGAESKLLDRKATESLGLIRRDFKKYARTMLMVHAKTKDIPEDIAPLLLESW